MKGEPKTTPLIDYLNEENDDDYYSEDSDSESENSEISDTESDFTPIHLYFTIVITLLLVSLYKISDVKEELKNIFIDE